MRPRPESGFTIIELMIVITIAAVLASLALPSFQYLTATTGAKSAATELYLAMLKARSEAAKRNKSVTILPAGGDWNAGWSVIDDRDNDGNLTEEEPLLKQDAISGVNITLGPAEVKYTATGRLSGVSPKFQVTAKGDDSVKRCIEVELTGRPYITKYGCPP